MKNAFELLESYKDWTDKILFGNIGKPKRARTKSGKFIADDPKTPNKNEAWVGGKKPKKKAKKK
jgi:hypothetical protein